MTFVVIKLCTYVIVYLLLFVFANEILMPCGGENKKENNIYKMCWRAVIDAGVNPEEAQKCAGIAP